MTMLSQGPERFRVRLWNGGVEIIDCKHKERVFELRNYHAGVSWWQWWKRPSWYRIVCAVEYAEELAEKLNTPGQVGARARRSIGLR